MRMDQFNVGFLSVRWADSFTHWHYHEDFRQRLIQYIDFEIQETMMMGDDLNLCWFSDHGGTPLKQVFHINKWLREKGWLDWKYLAKRHKDASPQFPDQADISSPFVEISDDSKAICADAFDSCIDILNADEEDVHKLRQQLRETGMFNEVYLKEELYPGSENNPKIPRIIPDRKEGVLVSGNIHPNAEKGWNIENSRDGEHSTLGCFGANKPLNSKRILKAQDFHKVIEDFVKSYHKGEERREEPITEEEADEIKQRLQALGYV